ncbi:Thioesterase superfamily protein [Paracoccus haematequi]|uniref:Medium/long-chain acyl-CoA thioesterase YigI n=1 Tax=Paracoccus haematequi TaxID=2491866 RepID=A0A3S4ETS8_9RHOB|nr:PaaI family thioesterase [Paracoccus haematequi]VDS10109.1 Thioesterase superfamily protein [Paracoccus haematequi]
MDIGSTLPDATVARIRDSFARQGLMGLLGAELAQVKAGLVTIRLPFRPELTQQHGYFHAGGTASVADSAGGYAGFTLFPDDSSVLTVEFKLNLMNPAQGDHLEAVGRVIKPGRTLTICQLDVWGVAPDRRIHVATGLQTLICVQGRPA